MNFLKRLFGHWAILCVLTAMSWVHAATINYPLDLAAGWNLMGNSLSTPLDVRSTLGAQNSVVSVWKWDATNQSWAFYSPSYDAAGTLASYAASKGYSVLTTIQQGEGYWVNASAPVALGIHAGPPVSLAAGNLVTGWNLTATGDAPTPSALSGNLGNVTTLWAWDTVTGSWYFHSPSLQAGNTLASYNAGKGYKDFGAMTLGYGRGFWINYAGTGAAGGGGSTPACLITAGTAKICYASLPVPFTCDATGMNDSTWVLGYAGYTGKTYQALSSCSGVSGAVAGTVFTTIASDAVVLTPFGTALSLNGDYLDAPGNAARFNFDNGFGTASGITWDGTTLWVADTVNKAIRKLDPATGVVSTLNAQFTNPDTAQTYNPLNVPKGITSDSTNLYVTDQGNIYQIAKASGVVTILSGNRYGQVQGGWGNVHIGTLPGTSKPSSITNDGTYLYFSDLDYTSGAGSVIKMNLATKVFTTVTTMPSSNAFTAAGPRGITTDGTNLYVVSGADKTIVKIVIATGAKTTLAGNPAASSMRDGLGAEAVFTAPIDIATDGTYLYVTDSTVVSGYNTVRKIEISTGIVTTLAGGSGAGFVDGGWNVAVFSGLGAITNIGSTLYVTDNLSAVRKILWGAAAQGIGNIVTPRVPVAPTVTATVASASAINISWPAVNTATGYTVYRTTNPNLALSAMTKLNATPQAGTSYADSGLSAATVYYYFVVASNTVGSGAASSAASTTTVPAAPANLSASAGSVGDVSLTWSSVTGTTGYDVYRSTTANQALGSMTKITASPIVNFTAYTDTGLTTGTTYFYKVVALSATGMSAPSSEASSIPGAPQSFMAGTLLGGARQGNALSLSTASATYVSTFAGSGASGATDHTTGTLATFTVPTGVTTDGINLYVADQQSNMIRKILIATGAVSTLAGSITQGSTDGTGTAAKFNWPTGITTDGTNLYVVDAGNRRIRKIVIATGVVSTLAGNNASGSVDGIGTLASFNTPQGITTDGVNLYVTDINANNIRKIVIATGAVSTLATMSVPRGITTDGTNLYVASTGCNCIAKVVIATGAVSTFAGSGSFGSADGTGVNSTFWAPYGVVSDGVNLYVADQSNQRIRKIVIATAVVSTVAGGGATGSADGPLAGASFRNPWALTTDGTHIYVADTDNNKIRKLAGTAPVVNAVPAAPATVSATTTSATSITISWSVPTGASAYDVYRSTTANQPLGSMTKLNASAIVSGSAYLDTGLGAATYYYKVVALNSNGASSASAEVSAMTVPPTPGGLSATTGSATTTNLTWTAVTGASGYDLYRATSAGLALAAMTKITPSPVAAGTAFLDSGLTPSTAYYYKVVAVNAFGGSAGSTEASATTSAIPTPPAVSGSQMGGTRQGLALSIAAGGGVVTTLAGQCGATAATGCGVGSADATGALASFNAPNSVTTDGSYLYVADAANYKIRKVSLNTGAVTTLAGSGAVGQANNSNGSLATFTALTAITTDGTNLFVVDSGVIRKVVIASGSVSTLTIAGINAPVGVTTDGTYLYVYDSSLRNYYKVNISTLTATLFTFGSARSPIPFGGATATTTDGTSIYAMVSASGILYKVDIATGTGTVLAGAYPGFADGTGAAALFSNPTGLTSDGTNLYVADQGNRRVRKVVISTGAVTTLAGSATQGMLDGTGANATLWAPSGITTDGVSLYVTDNNKVRKVQ